jgi:simple sugar transport system substrate-binding protein
VAKRLKFYAVTHDILGDVFWEVFRRGLVEAAERYDVDVEHLRPGKFSPEIQAGLIEGAIHARPDGLISTVPDVGAVEGPLRQAVALGIPLICINAKDPRPEGERIPYMFYIGGDDGNAGELAGRYVLQKVRPRAALCVDHYLFEHICHNDRWQGFRRAIEAAGVPVERLRIEGGKPEACASAVRAKLEARPDIDAVLTLGPPGAQAVLAQLQIDAIRSGRIMATIDSQQYLQGYLSVEAMWLHKVKGFTLASDIYTGPAIVDISNLALAEDGVRKGYR